MSFKISTGIVQVPIERDDVSVGEITFNPADTAFREAVVALYQEANEKKDEWTKKATVLDEMPDGEPGDSQAISKFTAIAGLEREAFEYFKSLMDRLFGPGSGTIVFGDSPLDIDTTGGLFLQFMQQAVMPHLEKHVQNKRAKYVK